MIDPAALHTLITHWSGQEGGAERANYQLFLGQLEAAVAAACGWADSWNRGDLPPAQIVARLVALNAERAAEEAANHIRWLRPDYQQPRFAKR